MQPLSVVHEEIPLALDTAWLYGAIETRRCCHGLPESQRRRGLSMVHEVVTETLVTSTAAVADERAPCGWSLVELEDAECSQRSLNAQGETKHTG